MAFSNCIWSVRKVSLVALSSWHNQTHITGQRDGKTAASAGGNARWPPGGTVWPARPSRRRARSVQLCAVSVLQRVEAGTVAAGAERERERESNNDEPPAGSTRSEPSQFILPPMHVFRPRTPLTTGGGCTVLLHIYKYNI